MEAVPLAHAQDSVVEHGALAVGKVGGRAVGQLHEAHRKAPDVHSERVVLAADHLGRHPEGGAAHLLARPQTHVGAEAVVDQLDVPTEVKHDIGVLDVAMRNVVVVQERNAPKNLACHVCNVLLREMVLQLGRRHLLQRAAVQAFLHKPHLVRSHQEYGVQLAKIGVARAESLEGDLVQVVLFLARGFVGKDLHRHFLVLKSGHEVLVECGHEHLPVPAAPQA
mmetsp:Transcript_2213/g.5242  ORF Transcript_2213/g.5242 Transcript_2213/m.5242 type:complete len:223 (+) Transcript_2213:618-1286(+)